MSRRTKASRRESFRRANTVVIPEPPSPWVAFDGRVFMRAARRLVRALERAARRMYLMVRRRLCQGPPYFSTPHPVAPGAGRPHAVPR